MWTVRELFQVPKINEHSSSTEAATIGGSRFQRRQTGRNELAGPSQLLKGAVAAANGRRSSAGMPPDIHQFGDLRVEVSATKRVSLPGTPYLAGSALDLPSGIENVIRFAGVSLTDAIDMATLNPWELLNGPQHGRGLVPGAPADLVLFKWHDERKQLELTHTIAAGEVVLEA